MTSTRITHAVTACWFLLVSWFRIMQSLTGCKDLDDLIKKLKTED